MDTLGERLNYARKKRIYAEYPWGSHRSIPGRHIQLGKNKTVPQTIVINAICKTLKISKDWLLYDVGEMEDISDLPLKTKILAELYQIIRELSEDEQLYLLNTAKSLRR